MAGEVNLPTVTDDSGDGVSGTPFNAAFRNGCETAINAKIRSGTNPTISPADTTDRVETARGSMASINARISQVVDSAGNPVNVLAARDVRNGLFQGNLGWNDTFLMWSRGGAAAPDGYALSGAGAAIARCGSGLADTTTFADAGTLPVPKITYGSAAASLKQKLIEPTPFALIKEGIVNARYRPVDAADTYKPGYEQSGSGADLNLIAYAFGHMKCNGTSRARLRLAAGGGGSIDSDYHPGNNAWRGLIAGPLNLGGSLPDELSFEFRNENTGDAYCGPWCVVLTPTGLPPMFVPAAARIKAWTFPIIATPTAATGYGYFIPQRPVQILGLAAYAATAVPTGGTTLKLDLMTPVGGTFVTLFSTTKCAFVASDRHAFQACNVAVGDYRRLTCRGFYAAATAIADNSILRLDVDTRDSGNTGAGIVATVYYLEYVRPWDQFRLATDLGEA